MLTDPGMTCKPRGKIYSINEVRNSPRFKIRNVTKKIWQGYEEHWEDAVKEYVKSKKMGSNPYGSRLFFQWM